MFFGQLNNSKTFSTNHALYVVVVHNSHTTTEERLGACVGFCDEHDFGLSQPST